MVDGMPISRDGMPSARQMSYGGSGGPGGPSGPGGPAGGPPMIEPISGGLTLPVFGRQYASVIESGRYTHLAMWFLDVRNFRAINPRYGFSKGNAVLRTVVTCMRETVSEGELPVARLGGDRFIAISAHGDSDSVSHAFDRLQDAVKLRIAEQGIGYPVMLCAGVYILRPVDLGIPSHQKPLDYASIAHRNAHDNPSGGVMCFSDEDYERDMRRIAIEQSIDDALLRGRIEVWYQPQVDYALGEVIGAEALARWNHQDLGLIMPDEFIPILENCGKIHSLDIYVWEEVCRNAGRWHSKADSKPVPVSVNVSRTEMLEPDLLERFLDLQLKYDLPPGSIRLEITESAFVEDAERISTVVERLREHDMMVEMDDFGSGLSSLNMLKGVPVDVVKLDMGFMQSAMVGNRGGVVLGSVIRMLQGLDTPIIAEGVETLEQAEMLKNMGCHLMQGNHFSRPMSLDEFESFIVTNRAVEHTQRRVRSDAHLDDLTRIDAASSYLFNHVMGPTMFFFAGEGGGESILTNDEFYEACGFVRGNLKGAEANPLLQVKSASRQTMWRAAAEAREYGAATCEFELVNGRWVDAVIRYLGMSSRGEVYSMNILRVVDETDASKNDLHRGAQTMQDVGWNIEMLDAIVPNSFVKCKVDDTLSIAYISPKLYEESGLSESEFVRRFHNALEQTIVVEDRQEFMDAVAQSARSHATFSCDVRVHYGYGNERRNVNILGRVMPDKDGVEWLYALLLLVSEPYEEIEETGARGGSLVITFDYEFATDCITIHTPTADGVGVDHVIEHFLRLMEELPNTVTRSTAAKIISTISDLRTHPTAGFSDIKCNLREGDELRWYHVNYTCEADENGITQVIHGYAQDSNDQMGSVRWWRRQAEIDPLTGLLNRNAAEQNINLAIRTEGEGLMFMIDLDGFKKVNDEQGHLAGDALLRDVAAALQSNFREGDLVGRYGGDEFVAYMALTGADFTPSEVDELARRRARSIIASVNDVGAACSVGVAVFNQRDATFYDLLEVADDAMYQSKESGKGTYTILEL